MKKGVKDLIKKLETIKARIAKDRDEMRDTLSEYEDIVGSCDEAYSEIESVIDTLSKYC